MAEEQANKSPGGGEIEFFKKFLFWMERLAGVLIVEAFILTPRHYSVADEPARNLFFQAAIIFALSNCFYLLAYIIPQVSDKVENGTKSTDKKKTEQEKAKVDSASEEEDDQESYDSCDEWEEERSQLMYELGAAKASAEIYKQMLHDLNHHDQPDHKLLA